MSYFIIFVTFFILILAVFLFKCMFHILFVYFHVYVLFSSGLFETNLPADSGGSCMEQAQESDTGQKVKKKSQNYGKNWGNCGGGEPSWEWGGGANSLKKGR